MAEVRFVAVLPGQPDVESEASGPKKGLAERDRPPPLEILPTPSRVRQMQQQTPVAEGQKSDGRAQGSHACLHCGGSGRVAFDAEQGMISPSRRQILERAAEPFTPSGAARVSCSSRAAIILAVMQKYSLPLIFGVLAALTWSNLDEEGYHKFVDAPLFPGASLVGHSVTLHFVVNDFFMCFFFGLAIKEVTEALLPGGSLSPLHKAINPLMATLGGVIFPIAAYFAVVLGLHSLGVFDETMCGRHLAGSSSSEPHEFSASQPCHLSTLMKGWGIPTATDISLAWMGAVVTFGKGHPIIDFLLLLAILDDALGMIIIAVFYGDPANPVEPNYLWLVMAAVLLGAALRHTGLRRWSWYLMICGPISWLGLILAHLHPALALVFVVPFIPADHLHEDDSQDQEVQETHEQDSQELGDQGKCNMWKWLNPKHEELAPLHSFELDLKLPVDMGMFAFGLANAAVRFDQIGGITVAVVTSLLFGKMIGISACSLLASRLGFRLPEGVRALDVIVMSLLAGVGLTVALFVAGEAFVTPVLQGEAKMGAMLSVVCGLMAWLLHWIGNLLQPDAEEEKADVSMVPQIVVVRPQHDA
eukprot:CAMPEP_0197626528 /NCGR_PEP_ID=MMETSP1338-20131121/5450_1 /TAXON_ID=43686 ORGANISM="Pelagodinium beii, Strain RCC1491" /NCGR_SAMPLE_ID=MMETSP1338 /ASSEMBLY_ACC=CAM_ASM_000754 /LENGTH=587 /DNA_ID=CAMNT_0043197069 /DNA_START=76 /DNA_END=1839 /DNA_ORIENTATION=-